MHRLTDPFASPQRLSQSVVQAGELLGLYRAEVARLLGFHCEDISALYEGRLDRVVRFAETPSPTERRR